MGSVMRSALEEHQLRSDPGGNDTLQAGADNNQCTWACGSLYRPYSPTWPITASLTRFYFKTKSSPLSPGPPGTTFKLDCGYNLRVSCKDINSRPDYLQTKLCMADPFPPDL